EFSPRVVHTGSIETDDDLQREDQIAVEISVQSVPIAWPVAEQQRRRARLAAVVALLEPFLEFVAPGCGSTAALGPVASDRQQVRPEGAPQAGNDIRNGLREVPILALAEPIARHVDRRAKQLVTVVETGDLATFRRCQDGRC